MAKILQQGFKMEGKKICVYFIYIRNFFLCISIVEHLFFGFAFAEDSSQLSLKDAVSIGLSNNKDIAISEAHFKKAKEEYNAAMSYVYPRIDGGISSGYFNNSQGTFLGKSDVYSHSVSLSLNQILYAGGRIKGAIKIARKNLVLASLNLDVKRDEIIYNICESYLVLKKLNIQRRVFEETIRYRNDLVEIAKTKEKYGKIPHIEFMRQELALQEVKSELIRLNGDIRVQEEHLKTLICLDRKIKIEGDINFNPIHINKDETIKKAFLQNPLLKQQGENIKAKELYVKVAKGEYFPNVSLYGNYNWKGSNEKFKKSFDEFSNSWEMGIRVDLPIFNGNRTKTKVKEGEIELDCEKINLEKLKEGISLKINGLIERLNELEERKNILEKSKDLAKEALRISKIRCSEGLGILADVTECDADYLKAQTNLNEVFCEYELNRLSLLKEIGTISEEFE